VIRRSSRPARSLSVLVAVVAAATLSLVACGDDGSDVPTSTPDLAPAVTGGTVGMPEAGDTMVTTAGSVQTDEMSTNPPDDTAEGTVP
jgi:hypothetical protein